MNQGAAFPTYCSARPPAQNADEPRSFSTIAAARQNEMNDNITDVATITLTRAGPLLISIWLLFIGFRLRFEAVVVRAPRSLHWIRYSGTSGCQACASDLPPQLESEARC